MIILHDANMIITGYQTYPETTESPHIVADITPEEITPLIGRVALVFNEKSQRHELPSDIKSEADRIELEDASAQARKKRDGLLLELDRLASNPLRWQSFSDEVKTALADYRLALLDVPQQEGFPDNITWPDMPDI